MNHPIQSSDLDHKHAKRYAPFREAALDSLTKRRKMSGKERRILHRATHRVIQIFPDVAVQPEIKLALKLQSLPLVKVIRRQKQFARHASTTRHLLAKMSDTSVFRPGLEATHLGWLGSFRQATAEIEARSLAAQGRLANAN